MCGRMTPQCVGGTNVWEDDPSMCGRMTLNVWEDDPEVRTQSTLQLP